ncbi:NPFR [Lepeophtheirus salmonis]|uniref:NPFR n=1 Tax=Lepeophtheirus salmonis TaxID=72036 RepID=A0A7R8CMG3_LEPSM|nr:NPFR [Lepeophtheirus salmonis]CAF2866463.1 NPFR [Lepeophtheirus salmonis]
MIESWRYQARVGDIAYGLLVALYASLIIFGSLGNLLVIMVVIRNSAMRTARNVFIVNLAISDLMLCLITMPLTLVEILYQTWQFGDYPLACPIAALLQATSIFVSTISITAIALDRRHLIVKPHVPATGIKCMLAFVPLIWGCALTLASPLAIWKTLENWTEWAGSVNLLGNEQSHNSSNTELEYMKNCSVFVNQSLSPYESGLSEDTIENVRLNCILKDIIPRWLGELQSCREDFPTNGRFVYSSITMLIQYLLPTITISVAYYQIYEQLNLRLQQKNEPAHKMRRTINLLISVGVIFCVCWLPLNILNSVMDLTEKSRTQNKNNLKLLSDEQFCILYAICHVMGMFSACANPVIYGYLNENFHREFMDILNSTLKLINTCKMGLYHIICVCAKSKKEIKDNIPLEEKNPVENVRKNVNTQTFI